MRPQRHRYSREMPAADAVTFRVGELNRLIRHALAVTFPDELWVEGEIHSLKRHPSGHVYFDLVDASDDGQQADATLPVALYRTNKEAVNRLLIRTSRDTPGGSIKMADGVHIRIRGALDYFPPKGRLSLRMTSIDPAYTLGRMLAERDRVLAALAAEGLIDRNRLLPFPLLPLRVGLVTGAGSAAYADFLDELRASGIGWQVTFVAARVQGPGAERDIAQALSHLEARGVDVIAVVRGGGARTDLLAFDAELVARTIAVLSVPVVTGIGHEIDTSVADAVAARAYKTPTACAAALVDHARLAIQRTEAAWAAIGPAATRALDRHDQALRATARHVTFASRSQLDLRAQHVAAVQGRVARAVPRALDGADRRLALASVRADGVDPRRALARGWSITRTADGRVVRHAEDLHVGDELVTQLAAGTVHSRVDATVADTEREPTDG